MYEISILCLLSEQVQQKQLELRKKIAEKFNLPEVVVPKIPAHITFKYRFPVHNLKELERTVQEICFEEKPINFTIQGFNYFDNLDKYAIFMDVPQPQEIRKIQANLYEKLEKLPWVQWGPLDNLRLHFHVTLAVEGLTSNNFSEVWRFVNQQERPLLETAINNLSLIKVMDRTHTVYKTFRFD